MVVLLLVSRRINMQQSRIWMLPDAERATKYRQRRCQAATAHARWAARKYAKNVLRSLETAANAKFEDFGGVPGITRTMATYQVYGPLQEFAARVCVRLVKEGLVKREQELENIRSIHGSLVTILAVKHI